MFSRAARARQERAESRGASEQVEARERASETNSTGLSGLPPEVSGPMSTKFALRERQQLREQFVDLRQNEGRATHAIID